MKKVHYVDNYILDPTHKVTVSLIGVGGTGTQVLTSLGRISYALRKLGHPGLHVIAYDGDTVSEANCGRQLFSSQEIGLNKAEVFITKLNMFFGTSWECMPVMYEKSSNLTNIMITCVDTVIARKTVSESIEGKKYEGNDDSAFRYWLDFGNMHDRGQVILGTSGKEIKQPKEKRNCVEILKSVTEMFDLDNVNEKDQGPSCSLAEALTKQDLFINSTLAQIGCSILWKMFSKGVLDIHGAFLNLDTMRMNPIKVK